MRPGALSFPAVLVSSADPQMHEPGDVFYLAPPSFEPTVKGNRPHVLLHASRRTIDAATLAYGSTRNTLAAVGAGYVSITRARALRRAGLSRPTFVYPARLVSVFADALQRRSGSVAHEMAALRSTLRHALGIGCGCTREPNVRGANRRGRLLRLRAPVADHLGTCWAITVTEPGFSRAALLQTVIPVFDADEFQEESEDLVVSPAPWRGDVLDGATRVIVDVALVFSIHERDWIARFTDSVAEDAVMKRVDAALVERFALDHP